MKGFKVFGLVILALAALGLVLWRLFAPDVAVLTPKGTIAEQQHDLIITATLLMLIVVLPVFFMLGYIAWKYRAGNTSARYDPNLDGSKVLESIWWGLPFVIIAILSVIIWQSSHALDPFRPLESDKRPLTIQVVALQWKWLFIYPEQDIASVNVVQFPEDRPINFEITADAPMNSFWIPNLGGQVYAMAGMETKLHLMASEPGNYAGSSANISGEGFSGMRFTARATSEAEFATWIDKVKQLDSTLDQRAYDELATPSRDVAPIHFSTRDPELYDRIIMKYMSPGQQREGEHQHAH